MYSEEEPELRDLIIQNLENCGFLNKIKAEIRAGVFLALEDDGNLRNKIPLFNEKFDEFVGTSDGKMMLSLVREFMEYFNFNFTLSVFDPEAGSSTICLSRSELCNELNLQTSDINGPVISALLKNVKRDRKQNSDRKLLTELKTLPEKSTILNEAVTEKIPLDITFNVENSDLNKKKSFMQNNLETFPVGKTSNDVKKPPNDTSTFLETDVCDITRNKTLTDILVGKGNETKTGNQDNIFKESKDMLSSDHDAFFDEPVPSEKSSFFSFSETLKEKLESKPTSNIKRDLEDTKKSSLSSLKDLPSLTANNEWTFSRDPLNNLPGLDVLKSFSSSETSHGKTVNIDSQENFEKKDSDIAESNEDSSEKQISEESIEEELEDDFSAGMDDALNSSLSLDITTDQTVSQVSVVEGVDHIEPCNS